MLSKRLKLANSYYFSSFLFEFPECMIPHKVCNNLCSIILAIVPPHPYRENIYPLPSLELNGADAYFMDNTCTAKQTNCSAKCFKIAILDLGLRDSR